MFNVNLLQELCGNLIESVFFWYSQLAQHILNIRIIIYKENLEVVVL